MKKFVVSTLVASLGLAFNAQAVQSGLNLADHDKSVRVQDDLYQHVNGGWLKKTEIPADKSNFGSFSMLDDLSRDRIKTIIEDVSRAENPAGSDARKVADFYKSFMSEKRIDKLGLVPLSGELAKIKRLKVKPDVIEHFGYLQQLGVQTPVGFYVYQDEKNSSQYISIFTQSGTTLPDRDYYLKDDAKFKQVREAYLAYIAKLLTLADDGNPAEAAKDILALETKLAEAQWTKVELRNPQKTYNKLSLAELKALTPDFDWNQFFEGAGLKNLDAVNISTPSYFQGMAKIFKENKVLTWQKYLKFKMLDAYAEYLPKAYADAHFDFHGKTLAGIPEDKPRWKKAVDGINGSVGELVGKIYVERHFKPEAKAKMEVLVGNLIKAFDQGVDELAWMSPETKTKAKEKLSKFTPKIGYPKVWRDYSSLDIEQDELVGNLMRASQYEYSRMIGHLGKPIDRDEWLMTPQTVNAYYNPTQNEIVFPAAILQPPFFNMDADDAANYGGIGAVIGHEISHGFDDQGSQYDGDGNLKNWWSEADAKAFKALTTKLVAQYAAYEPLPGKKVNGELTLGENIADLSGSAIAYKAYKLSLNGQPAPVIDGLSGDQRFFAGWAQVWARKYREPELVKRLLTDPHSPSQYRANGPVMNNDAFYQAFGVKAGDKLFKPEAERIKIW
ncbi:MAG: M13 family metallopeptidase [Gammaproteobacteria bacterium]|nr:M13 family metallopeptidase [Gammaproteobacteria bacterium]